MSMPGRSVNDVVRVLAVRENTYITAATPADFRTYSINNITKYLDIELPPMTTMKISADQPVQLLHILVNTLQVTLY